MTEAARRDTPKRDVVLISRKKGKGKSVREIPEVLHEQEQARAGAGKRRGVRIDEQSSGDATQLTEPCPMPAEDGAQQPRHGEHVLPVRVAAPDEALDHPPLD